MCGTSVNFASGKPKLPTRASAVYLVFPAKSILGVMTRLEINGATSPPTIIICGLRRRRGRRHDRRRRGQNGGFSWYCYRSTTSQPLSGTRALTVALTLVAPRVLQLATLFERGPRATRWLCWRRSRNGRRCRSKRCGRCHGRRDRTVRKDCNLGTVPKLFRLSSTSLSSRIQRVYAFFTIASLCIIIVVIFVPRRPTIVRSNVSPLHQHLIPTHSHRKLELHGEINLTSSEMSAIRVIRVLGCSVRYILDKFERMSFEALLRASITVGTNHNILMSPVRSVKMALDLDDTPLCISCLAVPRHGITDDVKPIVVALCVTDATHFVSGFRI